MERFYQECLEKQEIKNVVALQPKMKIFEFSLKTIKSTRSSRKTPSELRNFLTLLLSSNIADSSRNFFWLTLATWMPWDATTIPVRK